MKQKVTKSDNSIVNEYSLFGSKICSRICKKRLDCSLCINYSPLFIASRSRFIKEIKGEDVSSIYDIRKNKIKIRDIVKIKSYDQLRQDPLVYFDINCNSFYSLDVESTVSIFPYEKFKLLNKFIFIEEICKLEVGDRFLILVKLEGKVVRIDNWMIDSYYKYDDLINYFCKHQCIFSDCINCPLLSIYRNNY